MYTVFSASAFIGRHGHGLDVAGLRGRTATAGKLLCGPDSRLAFGGNSLVNIGGLPLQTPLVDSADIRTLKGALDCTKAKSLRCREVSPRWTRDT
jgi:hypothetical protein